eukprot:846425-Amphidinium_carterae.1
MQKSPVVFVLGGAWRQRQREQPHNYDRFPTFHVCLVTGVRVRVQNEDELRGLIERYYEDVVPSPRPQPLDMYRHDSPSVRAFAALDFRRLYRRVLRARPDHDVWLQYRFTPPKEPIRLRFDGTAERATLSAERYTEHHVHSFAIALYALEYTTMSLQELVL